MSILRLRAGAPCSHLTLAFPRLKALASKTSSAKEKSTFNRLGFTVATFRVLLNCAPPTITLADQFPVGAVASVAMGK